MKRRGLGDQRFTVFTGSCNALTQRGSAVASNAALTIAVGGALDTASPDQRAVVLTRGELTRDYSLDGVAYVGTGNERPTLGAGVGGSQWASGAGLIAGRERRPLLLGCRPLAPERARAYLHPPHHAMRIPDRLASLADEGIIDEVVRPLMSGKEAQVYLVRCGGEERVAKVYKEAQNRSFKHRATYTEGRTVRNTRDQRAMANRSRHGREQDELAWQSTEAQVIQRLNAAGVRVPVPFGLFDGVLVMELVKDAQGNPAPRLSEVPFTREEAVATYEKLMREVVRMLCAGVVHGDLSDFNVLVGAGGPVVIDFPQAINASSNTNAREVLLRDVANLYRFIERFVPGHRPGRFAEEMWTLYQRGELYPDTKLSGMQRPVGPLPPVDTRDILRELEAAKRDEERRRAAKGLPPIAPPAAAAPAPPSQRRVVVDMVPPRNNARPPEQRRFDGPPRGPNNGGQRPPQGPQPSHAPQAGNAGAPHGGAARPQRNDGPPRVNNGPPQQQGARPPWRPHNRDQGPPRRDVAAPDAPAPAQAQPSTPGGENAGGAPAGRRRRRRRGPPSAS